MRKLLMLLVVLLVASAFAQKPEPQSADLNFTVVKDTNGKPVRNASVVLHPLGKDGKQGTAGVNLKTDQEGKTNFRGIPYGKLRVQVIARGFQTFGEDYDISQTEHNIVIKLKPPADQYSIYEDKK